MEKKEWKSKSITSALGDSGDYLISLILISPNDCELYGNDCDWSEEDLQAIADRLNLFDEIRSVLEISKRELEYLNDKPWEAETVNYIVNKIESLLNKIKG